MKRKAKSFTQVKSFQVVKLHKYISPYINKISKRHNVEYKRRDIFKLIAELFHVTSIVKQKKPQYNFTDIETLYYNNLNHIS